MESNWFSKFDLYVIDEEEKTVVWVHENMVVLTASALMENVPKIWIGSGQLYLWFSMTVGHTLTNSDYSKVRFHVGLYSHEFFFYCNCSATVFVERDCFQCQNPTVWFSNSWKLKKEILVTSMFQIQNIHEWTHQLPPWSRCSVSVLSGEWYHHPPRQSPNP